MKNLFLSFFAMLLSCSAWAYEEYYYVDGIKYYLDHDKREASVTYIKSESASYSGDVIIPSTVRGFLGHPCNVTSIGYRAFEGCTGLTSITIPKGVTSIGMWAFRYCENLTSIEISNTVTNVDEDALKGTAWFDNQPDGLIYARKVAYRYKGKMPENTSIAIKSGTTEIASNAFEDCTGLTSIKIPNSVTSIKEGAFYGCTGLTSVKIPKNITRIGEGAFIKTAWFDNQPDGLVYVGKVAYRYKGKMPENTSIVIKDGTVEIASGAFSECRGLTSITIPNSVTSINRYAFWRSGLTSITIPNSVKSIGYSAFYGCDRLTSVNMQYGVENIGSKAFQYCVNLTSIKIPKSVRYINEGAFEECQSLTSVSIPKYTYIECIDDHVFYNCKSLKSITLPKYVNSIGYGAFAGCTSLTSITLPRVTKIDDYAFVRCPKLTLVSIRCDNLPKTGKECFEPGIQRLQVPKGTKSKYANTAPWNTFRKIVEVEFIDTDQGLMIFVDE